MPYKDIDYEDTFSERRKLRAERERHYKRKLKITALLIIILIISAAALCFFIFGGGKERGDQNNPSSSPVNSSSENKAETEISKTTQATAESARPTEVKTTENTTARQETVTQPKTEPVNAEPSDNGVYDDGITVKFNKSEVSKWYLKFIGPQSEPLPEDYAPELSTVQDYKVHSGIVKPLRAMISAAAGDGVNLYIVSGYRSYQRQKINFDSRVEQYIGQGMIKSEAEKKTAAIIAVPGTSEHHLGLACDFNSLDQDFEYTKAGKWLNRNAYKYGFILRYPKSSTDITGIIYEPWHFRYVSVGHAKKIREMGVTFEEYVDWLGRQG